MMKEEKSHDKKLSSFYHLDEGNVLGTSDRWIFDATIEESDLFPTQTRTNELNARESASGCSTR